MKPFTAEQAIDLLNALDLNNADLAKVATEVLHKRGFAVRIFGDEDVRSRLVKRGDCVNSKKVIEHVMQGDDWAIMEDENVEDDQNIWALIEGTKGDHPEWFKD